MIDTAFFRKNGFQYLRGAISAKSISAMRNFLVAEKQTALDMIEQQTGLRDEKELVAKMKPLLLDPSTDARLASVLRGEFHLQARLNPILQCICNEPELLAVLTDLFEHKPLRMHMPPMARFVFPQNDQAAVPPHNDLNFNAHLEEFVIAWMPLVPTNEQCGGLGIYEGLFQDPNMKAYDPTSVWDQVLPVHGITPTQQPMQPGDVLLMSSKIVHCSLPNHADLTRYSVDYRFFAAPARSTKHYLNLTSGEVVAPAAVQST